MTPKEGRSHPSEKGEKKAPQEKISGFCGQLSKKGPSVCDTISEDGATWGKGKKRSSEGPPPPPPHKNAQTDGKKGASR